MQLPGYGYSPEPGGQTYGWIVEVVADIVVATVVAGGGQDPPCGVVDIGLVVVGA